MLPFMLKPNPENTESQVCVQQTEYQNCITKRRNLSCKSLYFSTESIQASHASEEQELGRWCVTQSRSPEIVAPLIIKQWDSGFPHLYSSAVDSWHRHASCIESYPLVFKPNKHSGANNRIVTSLKTWKPAQLLKKLWVETPWTGVSDKEGHK